MFSRKTWRTLAAVGAGLIGTQACLAVTETAELDADGYLAYQLIGNSVSVSGDTVVAGAMYGFESSIDQAGNAYVFVRDGADWAQQAKLAASDPKFKAHFGDSVAIDGDTIVVGAGGPRTGAAKPEALAGAAYVFVRTGTTWAEQAKLIASDSSLDDHFGLAVGISGDTIVVGAERALSSTGVKCGAAYVFTRSGSTWTQQAKLTPDVPKNDMGIGFKLAIQGNTIICGAMRDEVSTSVSDTGSAVVFVRSGSTWNQQAKLLAPDADLSDQFGSDAAIDGDTALIGASGKGSAYIYTRSGGTWSYQAQIWPDDTGEGATFGDEVALSGGIAVVGASESGYFGGESQDYRKAGAAYVFTGAGSAWIRVSKLTPWRRAAQDYFAKGVALEGNHAFVGAMQRETLTSDPAAPPISGGIDSGAVFYFDLNTTGPSATLATSAAEPLTSDAFSVTLEFSASVTGLDASDIDVQNGTVSNFAGSGTSYTFDVTLDDPGTVYVNVPDGAALDAGTHPNIQSNVLVRSHGLDAGRTHSTDQNIDHIIQLGELLRVIQIYNSGAYHCAALAVLTEDGLLLGTGSDYRCPPCDADYGPQDWSINLQELLRIIQFYNSLSYHECPAGGTEDGFCPGS